MTNNNTQPVRYFGMLQLALLGALIATFCDGVHVYTSTLVYPDPLWYGQPWWPFPMFTLAFLSMAITYRLVDLFMPASLVRSQSCAPGSTAALVETLLLFALVYMLSGFGNTSALFLCVLFYVSFAVRLWATYERGFLLLIAILLAIGGTLVEAGISAIGQVAYTRNDMIGVPLWLPGLYLHGAFALREGYRRLVVGRA